MSEDYPATPQQCWSQEELVDWCKAVYQAMDNGWRPAFNIRFAEDGTCSLFPYAMFYHDFAKAFWGEDTLEHGWTIHSPLKQGDVVTYVGNHALNYRDAADPTVGFAPNELPAWQYHLQQMVLEENPIDYLRKFIDNG